MFKFKLITLLPLFLGTLLNTCQSVTLLENAVKSQERATIDDDLREFVEFIKLQMQCGYEPAGVPPLAPYQSEFKEFIVQGNTWSFKGNLSNLVITGLNEFDVVDLSWNNILQKVSFDLKFPSILAKSSYQLQALTGLLGSSIRFHGNGLFHLELVNLRAHGSFKLRPSLAGGLAVWGFKVKLDLETSNSKTTGIMGSIVYTKLFNSWVEEFIRLTFDDDNAEGVSDAVEYLVVPPLNKALKNISLVELIALIMGLAQDVVPTEAMC